MTPWSGAYEGLRCETTVAVGSVEEIINATAVGSTATVRFAGYHWYVVAKNDNVRGSKAALLLMAEKESDILFNNNGNADPEGYQNRWTNSAGRAYLSGENAGQFLNGANGQLLKSKAIEVTTDTRNGNDIWAYYLSTDKVFVLSEADVFGSYSNAEDPAETRDYTEGLASPVTINGGDKIMRDANGNGVLWPMRSPIRHTTSSLPFIDEQGNMKVDDTGTGWLRPAFWYDLDG